MYSGSCKSPMIERIIEIAEQSAFLNLENNLLREGFLQLQFSVYAKFCASRENAQKYLNHLQAAVPPGGKVRLLMITDKQFGDMISLYGKSVEEVEKKPEQLLLF